MLAHKWRNSEINQMPQSGQIGKYAIPKGYINATQMAKTNREFLSDYIRLKSTEVVQQQTRQTLAPSHEAAQLALLLGEFAFLREVPHRAISR
ncbi:hypothetical protein [Nostoc sp. C052]|uniref:hypothetical protein n=1 Tax=Nostoc sp. C052 TaxID=2576902 RepID=UPI002117D5B5|nr:hypothetical protein [Nostoc sp. C052]